MGMGGVDCSGYTGDCYYNNVGDTSPSNHCPDYCLPFSCAPDAICIGGFVTCYVYEYDHDDCLAP